MPHFNRLCGQRPIITKLQKLYIRLLLSVHGAEISIEYIQRQLLSPLVLRMNCFSPHMRVSRISCCHLEQWSSTSEINATPPQDATLTWTVGSIWGYDRVKVSRQVSCTDNGNKLRQEDRPSQHLLVLGAEHTNYDHAAVAFIFLHRQCWLLMC